MRASRRITSYNVCYTKLLRAGRMHFGIRLPLPAGKAVGQGTGGADVDAGAAEGTARIQMALIKGCADAGPFTAINNTDRRFAVDFLADPPAAAAQDAEIVIAIHERIVPLQVVGLV